jgi:hypothetical protein
MLKMAIIHYYAPLLRSAITLRYYAPLLRSAITLRYHAKFHSTVLFGGNIYVYLHSRKVAPLILVGALRSIMFCGINRWR